MKKIRLTNEDIKQLLNDRAAEPGIGNRLNQVIRQLDLINLVLDEKYNNQSANINRAANMRRISANKLQYTYEVIQEWYNTNKDSDISMVAISRGTKLHINTVRRFLAEHANKLGIPVKSLADSAADILSGTFTAKYARVSE